MSLIRDKRLLLQHVNALVKNNQPDTRDIAATVLALEEVINHYTLVPIYLELKAKK